MEKRKKLPDNIIKEIEKEIIRKEDGFYVYWPTIVRGYYNEELLRGIADELEKRNQEWQKIFNEYFEKES